MAFNDEALARAVAACSIPTVSAVGHEVDVSISDMVADVRAATPSHAAELVVPEREGLLLALEDLRLRLHGAMARLVAQRRDRLERVQLRGPSQRVTEGRLRLDEMSDRLHLSMRSSMSREQARLGHLSGRLDAMSPLRVLDRGYVVVSRSDEAVTSAQGVVQGDIVTLRFRDGERRAEIQDGEA